MMGNCEDKMKEVGLAAISDVVAALCDRFDLDETKALETLLEARASQTAQDVIFLDDLPAGMRSHGHDDELATSEHGSWLTRTGTTG